MPSKTMVQDFLQVAGVTINGSHPYDIKVHNDKLYKRMLLDPSMGAGEGYVEGWWDCESLDELFYRICRHQLDDKFTAKWMLAFKVFAQKVFNLQNRVRSKIVAEQHYNLGNDLYKHMLGKSMAYTCGYWKDAENLDQAQFNKFELICKKIQLKSGDKVLDLGCGWGSLAKHIAENYGCQVVGVNISEEQVRYAREINQNLPVEICLSDYRDDHFYNQKKISFDKVVSIGLCEHVGYKNYNSLMRIARENMKEDGLFLLHTIGNNVSSTYLNPWINKYIFPNGMLPSIKQISGATEGLFILEDLHNFGADYDKTLMAWYDNFRRNWPHLKGQYDEKFYRLWVYYLLSCAGAFRARGMQLWQIVLSPKGEPGGYLSIR